MKTPVPRTWIKDGKGFSLTEMLATMLILTLITTLVASGIPVAVDTYQKTVSTANAQLALSTTASVLRSEIGTATDVRVRNGKIYFLTGEGYWSCIYNPSSGLEKGLQKEYYAGALKFYDPTTVKELYGGTERDPLPDGSAFALIPDKAITRFLRVQISDLEETRSSGGELQKLKLDIDVLDGAGAPRARIDDYQIMTNFAD